MVLSFDKNDTNEPLQVLPHLMTISLNSLIIPDCWTTTVMVCLEKIPGHPRTDKIRIIHLYEADYNLLLKLLWGQRLVQNTERLAAYSDSQYGSRPGRSAIDAAAIRDQAFEFSRITRNPMGLIDNDATACYDRIITNIAAIACQ